VPHDNTNKGVLFKNERMREGKQDPNLSGEINIDGVSYWLSGWTNVAQSGAREGQKYISLSVGKRKEVQPQESTRRAPPPGDFDDDIPF
jgi:hypothetical protein